MKLRAGSPPECCHDTSDVLEVRDLSVCLGGARVIENLTFGVRRGTSLAIIGPNGVGKTVLLKAVIASVGFAGHVGWVAGKRVGYVPQKLDVQRDIPLTGDDFLRARGRLAHARISEIARVTELVGIAADALRQPIGTLSGGLFQRLLLAFALVGQSSAVTAFIVSQRDSLGVMLVSPDLARTAGVNRLHLPAIHRR